MPEIYPKIRRARLETSAMQTSDGKASVPLPGVKTDAKHVDATDKCGCESNRKLAEMIKRAVDAQKASDKSGAHFVLGWRLYPNKQHPRWKSKGEHACGCGCGCSA